MVAARRHGMAARRPRLVLRDHTRKTATCFTKFPPTQVASTLGLARCVVLWMILCHEQRTNYVKMWIFVIVESRALKLVKGHGCIPAISVMIFGTYLMEPYQPSVVCVWNERTKKECMQLLTCLSHMYLRVANVVADHDDLLTQWRPIKMSKFRANIFLIPTTSNYFWASEVFKN